MRHYPGLADPGERKVRKDKGIGRPARAKLQPLPRLIGRHGGSLIIQIRDSRGRIALRYMPASHFPESVTESTLGDNGAEAQVPSTGLQEQPQKGQG